MMLKRKYIPAIFSNVIKKSVQNDFRPAHFPIFLNIQLLSFLSEYDHKSILHG